MMTDHYLRDLHKVLRIFKIAGIYRSKDGHIGQIIYGTMIRMLSLDLLCLIQTLVFLQIDNIFDFADLLSTQSISFLGLIKFCIAVHKYEDIEKLVVNLKELLEVASKNQKNFGQHLEKRLKFVRKLFIGYWCMGAFVIFSGAINAVISNKNTPYRLPFKVYAPQALHYEYNYTNFLIFCSYQFFMPILCSIVVLSIDFLINYFLVMGAGLLEELTDRFSAIQVEIDSETRENLMKKNMLHLMLFEKNHEDRTVEELKQCIEIHVKIKEFLTNTQNLSSSIIFAQVIWNTIIVCMTCYTISMVSFQCHFVDIVKKVCFLVFLERFKCNILKAIQLWS